MNVADRIAPQRLRRLGMMTRLHTMSACRVVDELITGWYVQAAFGGGRPVGQ